MNPSKTASGNTVPSRCNSEMKIASQMAQLSFEDKRLLKIGKKIMIANILPTDSDIMLTFVAYYYTLVV